MRNHEKAQDVLQETFLTVHRKLPTFRFESAFSTWLYRVAYNTALMHLRTERAKPAESGLDDVPDAPDDARPADEILHRREALERVQAALDLLPDANRTVILLRDVEGLSTEETAEVTETTPAAVKTRLHRARVALRTALQAN
jgi:RNA polymerase sigma-70 factor (ECF subfamily)